MLERYLIEHCAPTLASIKTANLFNVSYSSAKELKRHITKWDRQLSSKGVSITVLRQKNGCALLYVCRRQLVQKDLQQPGVAEFLSKYGYKENTIEYGLLRLQQKLKHQVAFPHEIGLFLGYPLGDVIGFIENSGQNCKCCGCWKVYCDQCGAEKLFYRFKKCREVYLRLFEQGKTVMQLTVAA